MGLKMVRVGEIWMLMLGGKEEKLNCALRPLTTHNVQRGSNMYENF